MKFSVSAALIASSTVAAGTIADVNSVCSYTTADCSDAKPYCHYNGLSGFSLEVPTMTADEVKNAECVDYMLKIGSASDGTYAMKMYTSNAMYVAHTLLGGETATENCPTITSYSSRLPCLKDGVISIYQAPQCSFVEGIKNQYGSSSPQCSKTAVQSHGALAYVTVNIAPETTTIITTPSSDSLAGTVQDVNYICAYMTSDCSDTPFCHYNGVDGFTLEENNLTDEDVLDTECANNMMLVGAADDDTYSLKMFTSNAKYSTLVLASGEAAPSGLSACPTTVTSDVTYCLKNNVASVYTAPQCSTVEGIVNQYGQSTTQCSKQAIQSHGGQAYITMNIKPSAGNAIASEAESETNVWGIVTTCTSVLLAAALGWTFYLNRRNAAKSMEM